MSPPAWLTRRRRWRRVLVGLGLALLIVLMVLDRHAGPLYRNEAMTRYDDQRFEVMRVIDAQALEVVPDGADDRDEAEATRVGLWGVRPPEDGTQRAAAQARAEALALSRTVRLELEPHRVRDDSGRVLAYVHLPDGTMLNDVLLAEGLVHADDRWSHRHAERFELFERQARFDRRGVWGER